MQAPVFTIQSYSTSDPSQQTRSDLERSLISVTRLVDRCSSQDIHKQEKEWCLLELKKAVRAIQWDCDDLETTINCIDAVEDDISPLQLDHDGNRLFFRHTLRIVGKEPSRFGTSSSNVKDQKEFIESTRRSVTILQNLYFARTNTETSAKQNMASGSGYKYSRLNDNENDMELGKCGTSDGFDDILFKQQQIVREQDEDLELVSRSMGTLKSMSYKISDELESQNVMLDELGSDMDRVDSKLDGVMKKLAKLTHMDDDKRQCKMIFILSCLLFFLVFILIIV